MQAVTLTRRVRNTDDNVIHEWGRHGTIARDMQVVSHADKNGGNRRFDNRGKNCNGGTEP